MDECCIEYRVYVDHKLSKESNENEDGFSSVLAEYTAFISQFIGDYIWQNEPFNLSLAPKQGK